MIKQINMSQLSVTEKEGAVQEVKLLSELHHPFIVGYRESFLEGEILNIVMNYCEGGDLTTLIKSQAASNTYFPEEQILDWFIQLCLALRYIHQRRIIHRDLKSQNVFLTKKKNVRGDNSDTNSASQPTACSRKRCSSYALSLLAVLLSRRFASVTSALRACSMAPMSWL